MKHRRFTLVELLVVIAIILVLAGLLFPALRGVYIRAMNTKAKTVANGLRMAIVQYTNTYGVLPAGDGPVADYAALINRLAGDNPRKMPFFTPTKGLPPNAQCKDPWGNDLRVVLNSAGFITAGTGGIYEDVGANAAVWSLGFNKTDDGGQNAPAQGRDDVCSWR